MEHLSDEVRTVDDLATLAKLDEATLVEQLKLRYDEDVIYTYIGDILVAVNPFRPLSIYTEEEQRLYSGKTKNEAPPHIFAIADGAYHYMLQMDADQCIIISGESGAGKTESAKYVVKQIIDLSRAGEAGHEVEKQILQVTPLLEGFGNAQTIMNDNSSRVGRYTELVFEESGKVLGARISDYLLEKSRVVRQQEGEQNFHIFYYLFASPELEKYGLTSPEEHRYLSNVDGMDTDTEEMFTEIIAAMHEVGFSSEEQDMLFTCLAAILHTGNIKFESSGRHDAARITEESETIVEMVAELLQVPGDQLTKALTEAVIVTGGERIEKQYSVEVAEDCRDAMSKALYGRIFSWIIVKINELISPTVSSPKKKSGPGKAPANHTIGILDIFGFEHFDVNSYEQFCINLANEQLQHFFNQHVFQLELEEYTREGVDGTKITYVDNKPLLDMFLERPVGLFALLDEESLFPKGSDNSLVHKFGSKFGSHQNFKIAKSSDSVFSIVHFAGTVEYNANGFLAKNKDQLSPDVISLLQDSQMTLVASIFLGEVTSTGSLVPFKFDEADGKKTRSRKSMEAKKVSVGVNKRPITVGAQFTKSLAMLVDKMTQCRPHFVRCIKPNTGKEPWNFQDDFVMIQLRYTGMLETTRIRREGYAVRPKFDEFVRRFKMLGFGVLAKPQVTRETCQKILERSAIEGWLTGKTKIFLKYFHLEQLDGLLLDHHRKATLLQSVMVGLRSRLEFRILLEEAAKQKAAVKAFAEMAESQGQKAFAGVRALRDYDMKRLKDKILEEQEKATRAAKKRMQEDAEKAETERRKAEAEHRQLKAEVEASQADFESLSSEVKRIMSGDNSMDPAQRAEVERLVRHLEEQLQSQQASLEERVQAHEAELSRLQADKRTKESVLQNIQRDLDDARSQFTSAANQDPDARANLQFKVRSQELRLEEKKADLHSLNSQVDLRSSILSTVKSARNKVLGYVTELLREKEAIAAAYKAELAKAQAEHVKKLTSLKDEYEEKIDALEKTIMDQTGRISLLETQLASQQEMMDKAAKEHETVVEQEKKKLAASKSQVAELSAQLERQSTQLESLKAKNNSTSAELERVSAERDSLMELQKQNFEQKLTEAQAQLRQRQQELQEMTVANEAAVFQLKLELQQKDMQLQSAVAEKNTVVQELRTKIEHNEIQADAALRVELQQTKTSLDESAATVARLEGKLEHQAALFEASKTEAASVTEEYKRMLDEKDAQAVRMRQEHERVVKELEAKISQAQQAARAVDDERDAAIESLRRDLRRKDMELEDKLAEKDDQLREMSTQAQMLRAEIDAERVKVHSHKLRLEEADADHARLKERVQSQSSLFESQKQEQAQAHNELKKLLQEKTEAAESSRSEYKRIVSNIEAQLREEREAHETTRMQSERTITNMQDDYESRMSALNDQVFEREGKITDYKANLERAEAHVEELTSKLEEQAQLLDKTMTSLDDAVEQLEAFKQAEERQRQSEQAEHEAKMREMEEKMQRQDEEHKRSLVAMEKAIHALGRKKPGSGPVPGENTVDLLQYITATNGGEPVPSDLMLSRYTCKGWLVRPVGKNWQKRWFVFDLKAGKLTWYMNNRELRIHAKGNIPLCDIKKTVEPKTKDAAENNSFLVCTATRTHHMRASSPEAMKIWLKCYAAIM